MRQNGWENRAISPFGVEMNVARNSKVISNKEYNQNLRAGLDLRIYENMDQHLTSLLIGRVDSRFIGLAFKNTGGYWVAR